MKSNENKMTLLHLVLGTIIFKVAFFILLHIKTNKCNKNAYHINLKEGVSSLIKIFFIFFC